MKADKPIMTSLADRDFYKDAMGYMIYRNHANVPVNFSFVNRTVSVPLARSLSMGRLREELEHCRTLRHTQQELHYILGTFEYEVPMFGLDYGKFLEQLRLPEFQLEERDGQINLSFYGDWSSVTYWEDAGMFIPNELYYEHKMKDLTRFEREQIEAEGRLRLGRKIKELKKHPEITFSDFGTRRRFSKRWLDYVVGVLVEECRGQFKGTSNVFLAEKYGVTPVGTNAHELPMVYSGIFYDEDEKDPTSSQRQVLADWEALYGIGLSLFLPDTLSSDWFFKNVVSREQLVRWKGSRQDSGVPLEYAEKRINEYRGAGIDPLEKLIVFADGLNVEKMMQISNALHNRIRYTFGWGTDLTNDLGFSSLSIVVKAARAGCHPVAKLSDNISKATGSSEAIERAKRLIGYTNTYEERCVS